jgi:ribosomal protein S18 acetylase RimI-like enzyme
MSGAGRARRPEPPAARGAPRRGGASRVVIRPCEETDLDALEWDGEFAHDRPIIDSTFARTRTRTMLMLVAEVNRAHIGQAWIDLARAPGRGHIWALRVKPAWQGQGIGAQLLRACERAIAARGRSVSPLEVEPQNLRARALYERLGYLHVRCELVCDEAGRMLGRGFDLLQKCLHEQR